MQYPEAPTWSALVPIAQSRLRRAARARPPTTKLPHGHGSKPGLRADPARLATLCPLAKVRPLAVGGTDDELGLVLELVSSRHLPDDEPTFSRFRRVAYLYFRRFIWIWGAGTEWVMGAAARLLADERKRNSDVKRLVGANSVWPDGGIKSCQMLPKKWTNQFLHESWIMWNSPKIYQNIWATFVRKIVTKKFKKCPIWSHCFLLTPIVCWCTTVANVL